MTSPCLPYAPPPTVRESIAPLGAWLFVPDRRNAVGDVSTGYLLRNGERVVLAHTSRPLADLVRKIGQLESDFAARIGALLFPDES
ncbi:MULTISPECIES: hypothetical protein [Kitasatospora]|uniref:Uncharacterized protein n=1 Tax=Kitasatospora cathayae TaxID=3004092 RepID=A0ABY7Q520_9ACTN|nr:hypothetical protein [Kitasatospora sp. HUAS 3-15]WBP87808.1 hypothetical protein O1G21_19460 [Kitasatospora sp. HUAS 3-15]